MQISVENLPSLETLDIRNKIVLLHGDIANEQLMPKRFPFYNPESHQRIIAQLEASSPAAIITAPQKNPVTAGMSGNSYLV